MNQGWENDMKPYLDDTEMRFWNYRTYPLFPRGTIFFGSDPYDLCHYWIIIFIEKPAGNPVLKDL